MSKGKGFLKVEKCVVYSLTVVQFLLWGASAVVGSINLITSIQEKNNIYSDYKESAIYQNLLEEDVQRITDAYKNKEISLEDCGDNIKALGTKKQLKNYVKMDYEENKGFQNRLDENYNKRLNTSLIGLGVYLSGSAALGARKLIEGRRLKKDIKDRQNNEMDSAKGLEIGE